VASIFCNQCGHENPPGSRFCSSCGSELQAHHDHHTEGLDVSPEVEGHTGGVAFLVVTAGHRAGTRFPIAGDQATVGRHPDSDVFLDDITVSRRHVDLVATETGYTLSDVGSLNGTYVNGQRIDGEVMLTNGDEVQVGKFKLLYLLGSTGP